MNITNLQEEENFTTLISRSDKPFDYEKQLFNEHFDHVLSTLNGESPPPYEIEIQPTSVCNLRCKHCFGTALTSNRIEDKMGKEEFKTLAKRISEFDEDKLKIETVKFCGTTGEPLVNPHTVHAIKLFKDNNKKVIIYTNGLWLDKKSKEGKPYYEYILNADKINISLDSGTKETFKKLKCVDGFERIIDSIKKMSKLRNEKNSSLRIDISFVIGLENFNEIYTISKLGKESGADNLIFRFDFTMPEKMKTILKEIETQKKLSEELSNDSFKVFFAYSKEDFEDKNDSNAFSSKGKKCYNHNFWGCVGSNCELYACGHRTYKEVKSFGNLIGNSLKKLWLSETRLDKVYDLPDNKCQFCSPSCHRRDCLMGFLSEIGQDKAHYLRNKYVERKVSEKIPIPQIKKNDQVTKK
jgi:molybdenum cofactor biosynthesis enzyme MoaA